LGEILGLPLVLWPKQGFEEIGNALGIFYEVNMSFRYSGYQGIDHILVGLDVSIDYGNSKRFGLSSIEFRL
jgi:hypothetical protein